MTADENADNAARNAVIRACEHEPMRLTPSGTVACNLCGCQFAAMMLPVTRPVFPIDLSDYLEEPT